MADYTKKVLLETNLPVSLQSHWQFLMNEGIGFDEMQT
uniref:DUF5615 domain-containing protein n=1 Tax=Panagrellus redivivus TaxID=6233 RepID=A0A7E4VMH5_PANRE